MSRQSGAGAGADRWFGLIRNVVLAANLAAAFQFAGLSYWVWYNYSANYDAYRSGQTGAVWSWIQIGLITLLGLVNWLEANRRRDRMACFWLLAGAGALCYGLNRWHSSHAHYPLLIRGDWLLQPEAVSARISALISLGAAVAAAALGRSHQAELDRRPRLGYYWNWGVGLSLVSGIMSVGETLGLHGVVTQFLSRSTLLPESFFLLACLAPLFERATEGVAPEPAAAGARELATTVS